MPYYKRHNKTCMQTQEECLSGLIASSLDDIIYVNDPETYEILWLNEICGSEKYLFRYRPGIFQDIPFSRSGRGWNGNFRCPVRAFLTLLYAVLRFCYY